MRVARPLDKFKRPLINQDRVYQLSAAAINPLALSSAILVNVSQHRVNMAKDYLQVEKNAYDTVMAIFAIYLHPLKNYDDYTLVDIEKFKAQLKNALAQIPNDNVNNTNMDNVLLKTPVGKYGQKLKSHPAILLTCTTTVTTTVDGKEVSKEVKDAAAHNLVDKKQAREAVATGNPNGAFCATVKKIKSGLPYRVWKLHIYETGTKNIQLALYKIKLFTLFKNAVTNTVTPGSGSMRELLKTLLIDRALLSGTTRNHTALVSNIVLALKTDHRVSINVSLLVVLLLHQLKYYAASPQGELFAKVLKDFKEQHLRVAGVDYT